MVSSRNKTWFPWAIVCGALSVIAVFGLAAGSMLASYDDSIGFADEADRIADVLEIEPGMSVGDVRAGTGRWSVDLAQRIGEGRSAEQARHHQGRAETLHYNTPSMSVGAGGRDVESRPRNTMTPPNARVASRTTGHNMLQGR